VPKRRTYPIPIRHIDSIVRGISNALANDRNDDDIREESYGRNNGRDTTEAECEKGRKPRGAIATLAPHEDRGKECEEGESRGCEGRDENGRVIERRMRSGIPMGFKMKTAAVAREIARPMSSPPLLFEAREGRCEGGREEGRTRVV